MQPNENFKSSDLFPPKGIYEGQKNASSESISNPLNALNQPEASEPSSDVGLSEREAALALHLVKGIGPRIFAELIERFGSARDVIAAPPSELKTVSGMSVELVRRVAAAAEENDYRQQLQICCQHQIEVLDQTDEQYPCSLKEIYDPPPILFCRGNWQPVDSIAVSIVGSRHATHYGLTIAEKLATELAFRGFTIVSGLARGIDAAAHRGALNAGGRTIAVLGGGILNLYPADHQKLADQVASSGLLVSESLPWAAPKSGSFPRRNRIIAGLSLGVIVVEAGCRSGALITARLANEQGREVFAVPGRIDNRLSQGCHRLIRDGAKLVESADDVLEELGPLATPTRLQSGETIRNPAELRLSDQEKQILQVISIDGTGFDELVMATGLPPPRIIATISALEIRRLIKRIGATRFVRL